MPSKTSDKRYRSAARSKTRGHGGERRGEKRVAGDALTVALTAQLIICIILLAAAGVTKKINEEKYRELKGEYNTLTSEESQSEKLLEALDDVRKDGIFATMESMLSSVIAQITGTAQTPAPKEKEPGPELQEEAEVFDYHYLDGAELISAQGGMFQVNVAEGENLPESPAGTTLSPVYLSAKVKPPVTGVITSGFSYREHPITQEDDFHTGIDIAADEGSNILAALSGTVAAVGESDIYGNYVVLQHTDSLQTSYSHCSAILVEEGTVLRQGERIALVGQTGMVTGPHLHFSVLVDGLFTDPYWVLKDNITILEA